MSYPTTMNNPFVLIEFYTGDDQPLPFASLDGSCVPAKGDCISIRRIAYKVLRATWAIDHADSLTERRMRACVTVARLKAQTAATAKGAGA